MEVNVDARRIHFGHCVDCERLGESVDPQRLNELQHRVLEWAIFTTEDVSAFSVVWFGKKKDHTATDHRTMNAILDRGVDAFQRREEAEREEFRGQITAFRNLYAFLSQIIPYQDSELEQFYTFCRNLISKLPPPRRRVIIHIG